MIVDAQGRRFRNLRVSLTAACNYACTYCVPDGKRLQAAVAELSAAELLRAVRLLVESAGIDKLRITGGEPLLTPKFDEFLPAVMKLPLTDVFRNDERSVPGQEGGHHRLQRLEAHQRQPGHPEPAALPHIGPKRGSRNRARGARTHARRGSQGEGEHGADEVGQRRPDPANARNTA